MGNLNVANRTLAIMDDLALLHRTCNGIKRNRMTLEQLRNHNAMNGLLYVEKVSDLPYEIAHLSIERTIPSLWQAFRPCESITYRYLLARRQTNLHYTRLCFAKCAPLEP